jgi:hypothetical protein
MNNTYTVRPGLTDEWIVWTPAGNAARHPNGDVMRYGTPARATAVAEWLTVGGDALSRSRRVRLRAEIAARHGLDGRGGLV